MLCPSNPFLSLEPILRVGKIRPLLEDRRNQVVSVSPIIGGAAVKGPAARLLTDLGYEASAIGIATVLAPIARTLVIDEVDAALEKQIMDIGMDVRITETLMDDEQVARSLAEVVLA